MQPKTSNILSKFAKNWQLPYGSAGESGDPRSQVGSDLDFGTVVAPVFVSPKVSFDTFAQRAVATASIKAGELLCVEHAYTEPLRRPGDPRLNPMLILSPSLNG